MYVLKRDGRKEAVQFDKITERIEKLVYGLNPDFVDASSIAQKVIGGVYPGVTTSELDGESREVLGTGENRGQLGRLRSMERFGTRLGRYPRASETSRPLSHVPHSSRPPLSLLRSSHVHACACVY